MKPSRANPCYNKIMKMVSNQEGGKKLTVLVQMHGNEHFGANVYEYFTKNISQYPGLKVIFANEEAADKDVRYIDQDLNRAFSGSIDGNHEQRLAYRILNEAEGYKFLIDVHTTTSDIRMTPMVANLQSGTKYLVNATDSAEIVLVPNAERSSIGIMPSALLLEFNEKFANGSNAGLEIVLKLIKHVINGEQPKTPTSRYVYTVDGKIPLSSKLPDDAKDFIFIDNLGFPFLL